MCDYFYKCEVYKETLPLFIFLLSCERMRQTKNNPLLRRNEFLWYSCINSLIKEQLELYIKIYSTVQRLLPVINIIHYC